MGVLTASGTSISTEYAGQDVAFSNPGNAASSDNTYASATLLLGQKSYFLKVLGFNFQVPLVSTVDGIVVSVERSATLLNGAHDSEVRLCWSGSPYIGAERANSSIEWPTTDTVATYGSPTDTWGPLWIPADVNHSLFGVGISAIADLACTVQIDYVSMTVYYTTSNRSYGSNQRYRIRAGNGMSVGGD